MTVTTSWLMPPVASPQDAGPQWKLIFRAELECGPRHKLNGISEHNVWQRKGKNWHHLSRFLRHFEVFISIYHWNLCLVVQIYTRSDSELVSCPDLDNLDSSHYLSDYKLSGSKSSFSPDTQFPNSILWAGSNLELPGPGCLGMWAPMEVTQRCTVRKTVTW